VTGYQISKCSSKLVAQISTKISKYNYRAQYLYRQTGETDRQTDGQIDMLRQNFSNGRRDRPI